MGKGNIFILNAGLPNAVFRCPLGYKSVLYEVGWAECDGWNGECRSFWKLRGNNPPNTSITLRRPSGGSDLTVNFTIEEPPWYETCGTRWMLNSLAFNSSVNDVGYYVCYYITKSSGDAHPTGENSHFVRFSVALPVNVTQMEWNDLSKTTFRFTVKDCEILNKARVEVLIKVDTETKTCFRKIADTELKDDTFVSDEARVWRQRRDANMDYFVAVSADYHGAEIVFRLVINNETIIARSRVIVDMNQRTWTHTFSVLLQWLSKMIHVIIEMRRDIIYTTAFVVLAYAAIWIQHRVRAAVQGLVALIAVLYVLRSVAT